MLQNGFCGFQAYGCRGGYTGHFPRHGDEGFCRISLRGGDARKLVELRRCLEAGLFRPDWLLSREEIREKLDGAVGRKERNYWRCMGEMREVREGRRGER